MAWTLRRLGWTPRLGERVDEAELAARLRIAPQHRRLFGRMLAILAEVGILGRSAAPDDGWTVTAVPVGGDPGAGFEALARDCPPGAEAELELTTRVAAELAGALRGERDPIALLFPAGAADTAERMYRDSPTARTYNGLIARLVDAIVASLDNAGTPGRTLRILEIGAGTGGTTAHVLPRLASADVEYTFTDVGASFAAAAQSYSGGRRGRSHVGCAGGGRMEIGIGSGYQRRRV